MQAVLPVVSVSGGEEVKFLLWARKILGKLTDVLIKGREAGLYDQDINPRPWDKR